jgi:hypothetical protein
MKNFVLIFFAISLASCSKRSDSDKIQAAQSCLDTATTATWSECMTIVEGLESAGASNIRCVAKFIQQGFGSPLKLKDLIDAISNQSGSSESAAIMSTLAFTASSDMSVNNSNAQEAFGYCKSSGSPGLILLSSFSQIATSVGYLASLTSGQLNDPAQLLTAIGTLQNDPAAQAAVGSAAVAMYESNCSGSNASQNGDLCAQLSSGVQSAGGTSNPSAVGAKILACYANPNAAGCSGF